MDRFGTHIHPGVNTMPAPKEPLSEDVVLRVFSDLGLESAEKREAFQRLSVQDQDNAGPFDQVFIRIVSSTDTVEER